MRHISQSGHATITKCLLFSLVSVALPALMFLSKNVTITTKSHDQVLFLLIQALSQRPGSMERRAQKCFSPLSHLPPEELHALKGKTLQLGYQCI